MTQNLIYKNEAYFVVGLCMDVHNELGKGFSEAVYGDAMEIELKENGVPYKREVKFESIFVEIISRGIDKQLKSAVIR